MGRDCGGISLIDGVTITQKVKSHRQGGGGGGGGILYNVNISHW